MGIEIKYSIEEMGDNYVVFKREYDPKYFFPKMVREEIIFCGTLWQCWDEVEKFI